MDCRCTDVDVCVKSKVRRKQCRILTHVCGHGKERGENWRLELSCVHDHVCKSASGKLLYSTGNDREHRELGALW